MPCFYLTPKQDDFDKIPELQVCIAEALYDAEAVLSNPSAFKAEEIRTLRDQFTSNLERPGASASVSSSPPPCPMNGSADRSPITKK